MSLIDKVNSLSKKTKIFIAAATLVVVAGIVAVIVLSGNKYTATTMRLLRVEGTVNIENSAGEIKPVMNNIRFQSGDALSTGYDGLASVGLDETKIVTLESNSRVEFTKSAKQLELNLTDGGMFFEVTEKLKDDETFDITTSNMTVGIRGTSGYVRANLKSGSTLLQLTSGHVTLKIPHPVTLKDESVSLSAGQQALIMQKKVNGEVKNEVVVSKFTAKDLPAFAAKKILESSKILNEVVQGSGITKDDLLARAQGAAANLNDGTEDPEPTVTATPTPTDAPEGGDDQATTPTATPTITPPATATPTITSAPTITPKPTATSKPAATTKPAATATPTAAPTTATATPTANPTETATPTATAAPTMTATPTAEPTVTATPTASATVSPEDGFSKTRMWDIRDEDYDYVIYIECQDNETYRGYYNGRWINLDYVEEEDDDLLFERYYADGFMYYEDVSSKPSDNPPIYESTT